MMRRCGLSKWALPASTLSVTQSCLRWTATAEKPAATAAAPSQPESGKTVPPPPKVSIPVNDFNAILNNRVWEKRSVGQHVTVYLDSGFYAWIVMDRAGSSANALGLEFVRDMQAALDVVEEFVVKRKARAAVITSAKSTFCVGADLDQLYPITDVKTAAEATKLGHALFNRIERARFPIVAAINGLALGGGFELALACHHRVMSADAAVGLPECMVGLLPGAGGTVRLQRLVGLATAVEWIMTSAAVKAPKAKRAGAVEKVIQSTPRWSGETRFFEETRRWVGGFVDKALKPAQRKKVSWLNYFLENTYTGRKIVSTKTIEMLNKKTKGKYIAQYKALEAIIYSASHTNAEGFAREQQAFSELAVTPEAKNQMSLYFLDEGMKKSERKTGIPKDKVPTIKKAGVIGAGVMGSGIVHYFAKKGIPVAVKDVKQEAVDKGIEMVRREFQQAVKRKRMTPAALEETMKLVTGGTTNEIFKGADVVVEAVAEVMDVKKKLIQDLEKEGIINGKNLFATNTSSLSLTEMQTVSKHPQNIVGMHFFNPVSKMPLVEVIKGKKTSAEAAAIIFNLTIQTGKKPIIVNDAPGFLVNRVLGVYMAEAGRIATESNVDIAKIDKAILDFGMPMGPFRLLDEVGLDIACHVGPVLSGNGQKPRFNVGSNVAHMVKDGLLGKKNGKGFYNYDDKGKEHGLNTSVIRKYFPESTGRMSASEIVDRCVLLMVNEAAMILEEGVAASPEDVDIGMVWGTGFSPFRGGLMQYADHRGIKEVVERMKGLARETGDERFTPSALLQSMAEGNKRFFPNRPFVPYRERTGFPKVRIS